MVMVAWDIHFVACSFIISHSLSQSTHAQETYFTSCISEGVVSNQIKALLLARFRSISEEVQVP